MLPSLLDILRCPFCGSLLSLEQGRSLELCNGEVVNGILSCQCTAYPIVDGIPVLTTDYLADGAREYLANGQPEAAFFLMLGLDEPERQLRFRHFVEQGMAGMAGMAWVTDAAAVAEMNGRNGETGSGASYREGVEILCPDAEGTYFVYRFSDPTFLVGQTVLRAIGSDPRSVAGRVIDLCGGSGHLTRVLCEIANGAEVVLADVYFWKLWLAKRFTAPACQPVCCDANNPLPFTREAFALALCSDAFHYIWSKRLLANEAMRIVRETGVILFSHLHNALADNFSAGMPLSPQWWRNLFAEFNPRLFKESEVFENAVTGQAVDLTSCYSDGDLQEEAALLLIATRMDDLFRCYQPEAVSSSSGVWGFNPLYDLERNGDSGILRLRFPSPQYEAEFGACKRYLPELVEISARLCGDLSAALLNREGKQLIEKHIVLDLPRGYL